MSRGCAAQDPAHEVVGLLERRRGSVLVGDLAVGAPVVLEEVEAPLGEPFGRPAPRAVGCPRSRRRSSGPGEV